VKIRAMLPWVALIGLGLSPAVMAQTGSAPALPPTKFRVMDMRAAIVGTAEAQALGAQLTSQFAPQQAEMDKLGKQIEDIQKKGQAGANTLSDEEKAKMSRSYTLLQNQLKRAQDQYEEQMQAAQQDIIDGIGRKMLDVIDSYARENSLDCVLNTSGESIGVIYKSQQLDVTKDIVKLYDQRFPPKVAAATPATKPATPPATPPVKKPGGTN
jgi:Skp family chaperone for outer membrane proteins